MHLVESVEAVGRFLISLNTDILHTASDSRKEPSPTIAETASWRLGETSQVAAI